MRLNKKKLDGRPSKKKGRRFLCGLARHMRPAGRGLSMPGFKPETSEQNKLYFTSLKFVFDYFLLSVKVIYHLPTTKNKSSLGVNTQKISLRSR